MSDTQQGPDWWLASDGKWYPPQDATPTPTPPAPGSTDAAPVAGAPVDGGYAQPMAAPTTNSNATLSLILGIVSIFFCGLLTGIPAIFLGIKGRREIADSNGREGGDGAALGGIITGAIGTLLTTIFIVAIISLVVFADSVTDNLNEINPDPSDGICNTDRSMQDPDC
jgi:hypothetical protein